MADMLPLVGTADAEAVVVRTRLARVITNLFSPPVLAAPLLALGVWLSHTPGTWRYAALYLVIAVLIPLLDLLWLVERGRISDWHLADRRHRRRPFAVSIACSTFALLLLVKLGAPPVFVALVRAALLQAVLLFLITLAWQVSIHSATMAALATLSVLALGTQATGVVILVPVVGWARVHLGRHTVAQVAAGTFVGSGTLLVAMRGVLW